MRFRKKQRQRNRILAYVLCICMNWLLFSEFMPEGIVQAETQDKNVIQGTVGERLDGDYAYISDLGIEKDQTTDSGYAIRTGTAPWDDESEKGTPGNDTTELDSVVRSFDLVSYTVYFKTKVRENAPFAAYQNGKVYFEIILPGTEEQVQFDTDSMGWLSAKKEAEYDIFTSEYEGNVCQVLKGSFLCEPNDENPAAIGESYQDLTVMLRVLSMKNEEIVQPKFTFWLEGNKIPEEGLVTGSEMQCDEHGETEFKTCEGPEVRVTAAPRYNVQFKICDTRAQYIDGFDFSSGNDNAQNKDAGTVYGRLNVIGITLQIQGKSPQHGLRGCELPDGNEITFDVSLENSYRKTDGNIQDTGDSYSPLLWSLDGNIKSNSQADGREITGAYKFATGGAPLNKGGEDYRSCYDGGNWTAVQEGKVLHISVTGYQVNLNQLPYTDANVNSQVHTYYDPTTVNHYWEIQTACFSAGECWIVQPFYNSDEQYIADLYGPGSFTIDINGSNLQMTSESGQTLPKVNDNTNQMNLTDDAPVLTMALEQGGEIDQGINYQKYGVIEYGTSLTDGCFENGKDWIVAGGKLNIQETLKHNTAEGMYTGVAYDDLIKFDDTFFTLESVKKGSSAGLDNMTWKFLYGAKPDRKGWNHQGLKPEEDGYDTEMMKATADDLIFFSSLQELESSGYVCVAVLWEARGVASAQSTNCYIGLEGHVKESAIPDKVYMVTHSAKAWNKKDIREAAAQYFSKEAAALSDTEYREYAQSTEFPTREDGKQLSYEKDYLASFWTNEYETRDGLKTYQKSWYDASGYAGGSAGLAYADSCLVVSYTTEIQKDTAQQLGNGTGSKRAYDMDSNQRTADYVLKPSVVRTAGEFHTDDARMRTTLYIEDTLPQGLTYIPGSAYVGGTYVQRGEGEQGSIQGGTALEPEITHNQDGSTVLKWTLEDIEVSEEEKTDFAPIYYSCEIGTIGKEETDVKNNQQLLNKAVIWGSDEQKRDFTPANGNIAELSIQVSKNNAISLSKIADHIFVDVGESIGAVLNVGNNADNSMDIIAMDSLPYQGDSGGSDFHGICQVKELSISNTELLSQLKFYYTDDIGQRGKTSIDCQKEEFRTGDLWKELKVDSTTGKAMLPDEFAPVAIAAVGTLPGQKTLKMHITMYLPDGKSGDYVVNRLTRDELESDARTYLVSRALEGIVWLDQNKNGLYEQSEEKIDGVKVTLMKLKGNGDPQNKDDYVPYQSDGKDCVTETGKQFDLSSGTESSYAEGRYKFINLPEGTFGVVFEDGSFSFYQYTASPENQGDDDTIDSDGIPEYKKEDGTERLEQATISEIIMPSKEEMTSPFYISKHHDLGIYPTEEVPDTGIAGKIKSTCVIVGIICMAGAGFLYRQTGRKRRKKG